mmetsp:Transcript_29629/g.71660  ORF Transcript_29629/g.71660 Transcript_29629/m.71660 type:complete len:94 (-) Transcript_29629:358-639(-)
MVKFVRTTNVNGRNTILAVFACRDLGEDSVTITKTTTGEQRVCERLSLEPGRDLWSAFRDPVYDWVRTNTSGRQRMVELMFHLHATTRRVMQR